MRARLQRLDDWFNQDDVLVLTFLLNLVFATWLLTRYAYTRDPWDLGIGLYCTVHPLNVLRDMVWSWR